MSSQDLESLVSRPLLPVHAMDAAELRRNCSNEPVLFAVDPAIPSNFIRYRAVYVARHSSYGLGEGLVFGLIRDAHVSRPGNRITTLIQPVITVQDDGRVRFNLLDRQRTSLVAHVIRQLPLMAGDTVRLDDGRLYHSKDEVNERPPFGANVVYSDSVYESWLASEAERSDTLSPLLVVSKDGTRSEHLTLRALRLREAVGPHTFVNAPRAEPGSLLPAHGSCWVDETGKRWRVSLVEKLSRVPSAFILYIHEDKGTIEQKSDMARVRRNVPAEYVNITMVKVKAELDVHDSISPLLWAGLSTGWVQVEPLLPRHYRHFAAVTAP